MRLIAAVSFLVLLGPLAGCDRGPKSAGGASYAGGAVEDPRKAIIGRWTVDPDRLEATGSLEKLPEGQRHRAVEMARNIMNSMVFEFTEEAYEVTMTGRTYHRAYTVKSVDGQTVTVEAKDGEEAETLVLKFGEQGLTLEAPGEQPLPLKPRS
ncbi:MAG: hypothetical protein KC549_10270 [Myxococcales bacterium]|nr:hypothetical protein [Myxococcales bacterium]MCB9546479.1 hypothetical protein [Myxococcales bacterium]